MSNLRSNRRSLLALALLSSACWAGCPSIKNNPWWFWPFGKVSDTVPGITPPPQRMRAIRELAERAKSPDERQRTLARLAEMYPGEKDPLLRAEIVRAAGTLAAPGAVGLLREGLKDSDADVRVLACRSLGKVGGQEAVLALREALAADVDGDVRLAAAAALGKTGDPAAVATLGAALDDRDPAMQYRAVAALREVAPRDLGNDVERWRQYVRQTAPAEQPTAIGQRPRDAF